jgi:hypothetical protein
MGKSRRWRERDATLDADIIQSLPKRYILVPLICIIISLWSSPDSAKAKDANSLSEGHRDVRKSIAGRKAKHNWTASFIEWSQAHRFRSLDKGVSHIDSNAISQRVVDARRHSPHNLNHKPPDKIRAVSEDIEVLTSDMTHAGHERCDNRRLVLD